MRAVCVLVAAAAALLSSACGSATPLSATPTITETFTGTVQPQGSDSHNFHVGSFGEVDITLTAAGPPPTITVGLGVGQPSGTSCALQAQGAVSAATTPQFANQLSPGTYCVTVFDAGNQTAAINYSLTVLHP